MRGPPRRIEPVYCFLKPSTHSLSIKYLRSRRHVVSLGQGAIRSDLAGFWSRKSIKSFSTTSLHFDMVKLDLIWRYEVALGLRVGQECVISLTSCSLRRGIIKFISCGVNSRLVSTRSCSEEMWI